MSQNNNENKMNQHLFFQYFIKYFGFYYKTMFLSLQYILYSFATTRYNKAVENTKKNHFVPTHITVTPN